MNPKPIIAIIGATTMFIGYVLFLEIFFKAVVSPTNRACANINIVGEAGIETILVPIFVLCSIFFVYWSFDGFFKLLNKLNEK